MDTKEQRKIVQEIKSVIEARKALTKSDYIGLDVYSETKNPQFSYGINPSDPVWFNILKKHLHKAFNEIEKKYYTDLEKSFRD